MSKQSNRTTYPYRYLARVVFEAITPLSVGTGEKSIVTDATVLCDVNGLPYIPGTSLAGIIRHMLENKDEYVHKLFGFQEKENEDGEGSRILFSEARMIGADGKVVDGLMSESHRNKYQSFYSEFEQLPIRQHVRINERGTNDDGGKFDGQVVYKGTRFCFEIEILSQEEDTDNFEKTLQTLEQQSFRIGGGTRKGFGKIRVVSCKKAALDLRNSDDLSAYLTKSSNLSEEWSRYTDANLSEGKQSENWTQYELCLKPDDFFLFGSGLGDKDADILPAKEAVITWGKETPQLPSFHENYMLIPATSVKGAISHRVAYHYNRLTGVFAGENDLAEKETNRAVRSLFGSAGKDEEEITRGRVIFSDVLKKADLPEKLLNHVSIDRFTGGAIDGALFSEKTVYGKGKEFTFNLLVENENSLDGNVKKALLCALHDICTGMLPLGGGVNRGNGVFSGSIKKNGEELQDV